MAIDLNRSNRSQPGEIGSDTASLYVSMREELLRLARRILGDSDDAEDVLHSVMTRVLPRQPVTKRYLAACVRNEALRALRTRRRAAGRNQKAAILWAARDTHEQVESRMVLERAMGRLTFAEHRAVEAVCLRGLRIAEAARALGLSPRTIENQLRSARIKVRALK